MDKRLEYHLTCNNKYVIGVDEAGRGSLIGEMIVAGYMINEEDLDLLKEIGVKDSKELSREARRRIYRELANIGSYTIEPIPPSLIDKRSLTSITEEAISRIVYRLSRGVDPDCIKRITIDRYGKVRRLRSMLYGMGIYSRVIVEEKADSKYIEVSAASIIAKHVRDERIRVLSILYGVRGSGYPSDPRTVEWVMNVLGRGERPSIIRYSWGTLEGTGLRVRKGRRSLEDFM